MPPLDARSRQIDAEQTSIMFAQTESSQLVGVLNAGLVTVVLWNVAARPVLLAWLAGTLLIAAARAALGLAYRRASPSPAQAGAWRTWYVAGCLAGGVGWGAAGVLLFPHVSLVYQVFLAYVLGGMAVGAAAVMSPVLAAYWAFLPPITLPIIVQLFTRGDAMSTAMGVMFTACTVMFMSSARQMHASIADSIRLRFENLDLVESLSAATAKLTASVQEKDVLLTEIHHRVKNNLQVISSLLSLQSRSLSHPEAVRVFTESQNRVRSMALVHEKLYQSPDLAQIDFGAYLRELASYLCRVYHGSASAIPLRVRTQDVFLTIERAVPCGLIASEIISNALKYAFPDGRTGEIAIELAQEGPGYCRMTVRDDGVGLPPDVDLRHPTSLGLRIVNTLTAQLGGTIACANGQGAAFTLTIPLEEHDAGGC